MKLWVYCIVRNEVEILPFMLRHYETMAEKIIIYDDASTDGSREIIAGFKNAELRDWPDDKGLDDDGFLVFMERQYLEARGHADWVAWVDADEILWHPDFLELLKQYKESGINVPKIQGWNMMAPEVPTGGGQIYDYVQDGYRADNYSKPCLFDPNMTMRWTAGRQDVHVDAVQNIRTNCFAQIKLLHYRYMGARYTQKKNDQNFSRVSDQNRAKGFGWSCDPKRAVLDCSPEWVMGMLRNVRRVFPQTGFEEVLEKLHGGVSPYCGFPCDEWRPCSVNWGSKNPVLESLIAEKMPRIIVEVGTFCGDSAVTMGEKLSNYYLPSVLICVDTFLGDYEHWERNLETLSMRFGRPSIYYRFISRIIKQKLQNYVLPLPMSSVSAAELLLRKSIKAQIVYIDGGHQESVAYQDIVDYYDKVLDVGGVMVVDDYDQFGGVIRAVNRFCSERNLGMELASEKALIRKTGVA